jgi:hypothetical protein
VSVGRTTLPVASLEGKGRDCYDRECTELGKYSTPSRVGEGRGVSTGNMFEGALKGDSTFASQWE